MAKTPDRSKVDLNDEHALLRAIKDQQLVIENLEMECDDLKSRLKARREILRNATADLRVLCRGQRALDFEREGKDGSLSLDAAALDKLATATEASLKEKGINATISAGPAKQPKKPAGRKRGWGASANRG